MFAKLSRALSAPEAVAVAAIFLLGALCGWTARIAAVTAAELSAAAPLSERGLPPPRPALAPAPPPPGSAGDGADLTPTLRQ